MIFFENSVFEGGCATVTAVVGSVNYKLGSK